ncbi:MAG: CAP domain-containing protein [Firmicutes bacterium]|nr:CAP domain-containing protein [Bacillota bacterium]
MGANVDGEVATIFKKIKGVAIKTTNTIFTLLIIVAIGLLSFEAYKMHNGEDNLIERFAVVVGELSISSPPSPSSVSASEADNEEEASSNHRQSERSEKKLSGKGKEGSVDTNDQATTVSEKTQQEDQQDRKADNLDLPPEEIVFYRDLAWENIRILNAERKKRGIPELKVHDTLMEVAHIKVDDMMTHNYYGHGSPRIGCTTDYAAEIVGGSVPIISENLNHIKVATSWYKEFGNSFSKELAGMAKDSHNSLMRSDGHRENMLNPELAYVGVAAAGNVVVEDGEEYYVFKVAQVFMSE